MEKKYFQNIAGNYFTHRIEMQLNIFIIFS